MELRRPEEIAPDETTNQAQKPSEASTQNGAEQQTQPRNEASSPFQGDQDGRKPGTGAEEAGHEKEQDAATDSERTASSEQQPSGPPRFAFKDKRIFTSGLDDLEDEPPSSDKPTYVEQLERRVQQAEERLAEYIKAYKEKTEVEWAEMKARLERDMERQVLQARKQMVLDLLEVLDNFGRTVESAKTTSDVATLAEGMEMIERQFLSKLQALGLEPIEATGATFDPSLHEAASVEEVEDESLDGKVLDVYRQGYSFGGALLRPALVRVGKLKRS